MMYFLIIYFDILDIIKMYPNTSDPNFYDNISKKQEFYQFKSKSFKQSKTFERQKYQKILGYFMSPDTPYKNLVVFAGTGTGKTCVAVNIAEGFKPLLDRLNIGKQEQYHSFIYVIASNDAHDNFYDQITSECGTTANGLLPNDKNPYISLKDRNMLKKIKLENPDKYNRAFRDLVEKPVGKYYKFLTYLKIKNMVDKGEIKHFNNSIIIIDEVHNLFNDNLYAKAIDTLLRRSENTKCLFLTATPVFNRSDQIVEFLNLIYGEKTNMGLKKSDVFDIGSDGMAILKPNGENLLMSRFRGIISYVRGDNPITFPKKIYMGETPKLIGYDTTVDKNENPRKWKINYTKIVRCPMKTFQFKMYQKYWKGKLGNKMKHIVDCILPHPIDPNEGIFLESQLKLLAESSSYTSDYGVVLVDDFQGNKKTKQISGPFLKLNTLVNYSSKYAKCIEIARENIGTFFIYNSYVQFLGIKFFAECLKMNGFEEFNMLKPNADAVSENTICYLCGKTQKYHEAYDDGTYDHIKKFNSNMKSKSKNQFDEYHTDSDDHKFHPAKYFLFYADTASSKIYDYFNSPENKDGKILKIFLGSVKTRESINLKNVRNVIVMNYQNNFSKLYQIIGRSSRNYSHFNLPENQRYVKIYQMVTSLPEGKKDAMFGSELSAEEIEYAKDEENYIEIKKIERLMKISAVDCDINKSVNHYKNDVDGSVECDYIDCDYKCLTSGKTKNLDDKTIDKSTYKIFFKNQELNKCINFIRRLYLKQPIYDYESIESIFRSNEDLEFKFIPTEYIIYALHKIVESKIPTMNTHGNIGYITRDKTDGYYKFIPRALSNMAEKNISINQRLNASNEIKSSFSVSGYIDELIEKSESKDTFQEYVNELNKWIKMSSTQKKKIPNKLNINFTKTSLTIQQYFLEWAILEYYKNYKHKRKNDDLIIKIIRDFKEYLVDENQLTDNSSYIATTDDDVILSKKSFVGHLLLNKVRCINTSSLIFEDCTKTFKRMDKENDYIIGFMERDKKGKLIFKLKFTGDKTGILDARKFKRGFVCSQVADKNMLKEIAKKIGIKLTKEDIISGICTKIEKQLRDLQIANKNKGIRWFYEYYDRLSK